MAAGGQTEHAVACFAVSEVLEKGIIKNESEDELEGLAVLFYTMNGHLMFVFMDM